MTEFKEIKELDQGESRNSDSDIKATRKDLQLPRRLFHMGSGVVVATLYNLTFTHQKAIYLIGTIACILYVIEQIRMAYPKLAKKMELGSRYLLRAEEQLKESAAIPYVMAILLTILTFPHMIAVASIYTLAFADPLSAIIGIKFGKHHIVQNKTVEGSIAFLIASFITVSLILVVNNISDYRVIVIGAIVSVLVTIFEMLPIRLDDNLTIPLFTAFVLWPTCIFFGIPLV